ncbi:glycosyltransferase family 2 protein [Pseudomonas sichuanensis]|uniref:glycosyltransferase family 2 protein n=1 Tax=Pseudomonas TaxID=286 RepID=UPI0036E45B37
MSARFTCGQLIDNCPQGEHSAVGEHVAILMCTYNGEKFLQPQLDSIARQSHTNWSLFISDDGSSDRTHSLLSSFQQSQGAGRVNLLAGAGQGFVHNFLSLTCRVNAAADFFAWSDQDDIWCEDKLKVAVAWLSSIPRTTPALYCGRTQVVGEDCTSRSLSPRFFFTPHFRNALVQCIAGGNTMVFNSAARALIIEAGYQIKVPSHDWWCYQLISAAGGVVRYDPVPRLLYRQHGGNVIGSSMGMRSRLLRIGMLWEGRWRSWDFRNIEALEIMAHHLLAPNAKTLLHFKRAREQKLPFRLLSLFRAGVYRQTVFGNLGLVFATLFKKI